jgi:hypothetical protein
MSPLTKVPTADLEAEMSRRRKRAAVLLAEAERLRVQIERIDARLAGLRVAATLTDKPAMRSAESPRSPRAKNDVTLADAIAMAVEARATVTPAEAVTLVLANGYRTASKTFNVAIATALAKSPAFKRVGRGQYQRRD